jgi:hypothetical protein
LFINTNKTKQDSCQFSFVFFFFFASFPFFSMLGIKPRALPRGAKCSATEHVPPPPTLFQSLCSFLEFNDTLDLLREKLPLHMDLLENERCAAGGDAVEIVTS